MPRIEHHIRRESVSDFFKTGGYCCSPLNGTPYESLTFKVGVVELLSLNRPIAAIKHRILTL